MVYSVIIPDKIKKMFTYPRPDASWFIMIYLDYLLISVDYVLCLFCCLNASFPFKIQVMQYWWIENMIWKHKYLISTCNKTKKVHVTKKVHAKCKHMYFFHTKCKHMYFCHAKCKHVYLCHAKYKQMYFSTSTKKTHSD